MIYKRTRLSRRRMIWLLPESCLSSQSSCVSPVEHVDGRGGKGWARSQIIRRRDSLVLDKSFNTLCSDYYKNKFCPHIADTKFTGVVENADLHKK
jgi:hypothetical protein